MVEIRKEDEFIISGFDLMAVISGAFGFNSGQIHKEFYENALRKCLARPVLRLYVWDYDDYEKMFAAYAHSMAEARELLVKAVPFDIEDELARCPRVIREPEAIVCFWG